MIMAKDQDRTTKETVKVDRKILQKASTLDVLERIAPSDLEP
jgi:hypothetical protein